MSEPANPEVEILNAALELREPERSAYLDKTCAGNAALRQRVLELLQAHEQAENFLEAPPSGRDLKRTVRMDVPLTEKPGDRIGRYKLLQQIGEGGCGVVYMAEQEQPVRRRVALKVIKLGMDTKSVIARFEAERQALALMDHPNIAKVFDAGSTERPLTRPTDTLSPGGGEGRGEGDAAVSAGRPYFVMELVRGIKITDYCDENKISTEDRLKLFIQVCQAIQHAHQKGIIHRDIKPSNILVTINDGVPVPKVIDFGIAKATQGRLTDKTLFTAFEQFIGTPAYMSPEQAVMTSLDIDTRSDIYSLGVLLYELLTGKTPFDGKELLQAGLDAMRRTIRETEPPKPSTRLSTMLEAERTAIATHRQTESPKLIHLVRGDLDWIVMKSLEKDRARRYETANGLAADIQRHLKCEPVVARPPSKFYEFQKTVRRHKFGFGATAVLIAVLAVGIVVSTSQAIRATRAEREQIRLRQEAEAARANEAKLRQQIEVRLTVAHARTLSNNGKYGEAEKLLNGIEPSLIEPDANHAALRRLLAWEYAKRDEWPNVLTNVAILLQIDGSAWDHEVATDHYYYTTTLAVLGDKAAFDGYRRMIVARFPHSSDVELAEFLCRITLMMPADAGYMKSLIPFAELAATKTEFSTSHPEDSRGWNRLALALMAYRSGDYTNAMMWSEDCVAQGPTDPTIIPSALSIRAMAHYQLHQDGEAALELFFAHRTVDPIFKQGASAFSQGRWFTWLEDRIWLNEATGLIGKPSVAASNSFEQVTAKLAHAQTLGRGRNIVKSDRTAYEEADRLLNEIPAAAIRADGRKSGDVFASLGWWHLNMHEWPQAIARWGTVLFGPDGHGCLPTKNEPTQFLILYAAVPAVIDDKAAYEQMRTWAIARYGNTTSSVDAQRTLTACLLMPPDANQMRALEKMSAVVDPSHPASQEQWADAALSLLEYRRGNYNHSLQFSRPSAVLNIMSPTATARRHVLAALAYAGLGARPDARTELAECKDIILKNFSISPLPDRDPGSMWYDWWINHLLLREAIAAVEGPDAVPPPLPQEPSQPASE